MINKSTIKKMTRSVTYQKGMELYYNSSFLSYNVNTYVDDYGDEIREVTATAEGSYHNEYDVEITVNETTSEIAESYCDCPAFENYEGICKHCVATLLEYLDRREDIRKSNASAELERLLGGSGVKKGNEWKTPVPKRQTSHELKRILSRCTLRENAAFLPETNAGQVHLEPILTYSQRGFTIRFRIGITQMYVLKNIFKFVMDIHEMNTVSYGKKLEFLHCKDAFDEESKGLIHFMEKNITPTELEYYRHYGIIMRGESKEITLDESELDEVMNMYLGKTIRVEYQTGREVKDMVCQVVKGSLGQKISIREEDEGIVLQHKIAKGIKGSNYIYYVSQPRTAKIYMVERKNTENLEEFLAYMEERKGNDVFIGKEELPAFCCNVLPQLEKSCNVIRGDFLPEKYLPEKATFQFYLDAPQRDMVTCRAIAVYGNHQYNLFPASDEKVGRQVRDLQREGYAKTCILKYFYAYEAKTETMALQGEEDMYHFLTEGIEVLKNAGEVFIAEELKKIQIISKVTVQVGVSLSGNLLRMELGSEQFSKEQLAEILSRYEKKKRYYRLKSGEFIRMDENEMQVLCDLREDLQLTDKQLKEESVLLPSYRAMYLDSRIRGEGFHVIKNREFKQLIRDMKTIEDNDFEMPDTLVSVLREYQKTGFLWMKTLCHNQFGGILADDMGLGKTLQTITFLLSEFREAGEDKKRALIVTPASLVYNWKSEFEKFAPELMVHMVVGTVKEREQILSGLENKAVIITSYQLLYRDEALYEKIPFDFQIIDEAQFIKNQGNQTTKAVKAVDARFRMALTGTPIENKLSELWSIFDYIMPGFLYKYQRFRKEIETPVVKSQDQKVMERLQKMIQPFVLRRTKREVLKELPDKIERCMYAQLEGEQREIYLAHSQRLQMQLKNQTEEEFKTSKIQILAEITRLRQICCDPALFYEKYEGPSAKLELCIELIKNAVESGHKILLFSQFTTMLDRITKALEKNEISYYLLTGKTSKEERAAMADRFNKDDTSVFCISLKAGGTGLNLTGADMVIHYDPWWNAAVETQATDRAHRIGQKQVVTVYKLIARDTLEEKIIELQSKKKELASQVMAGEGVSQTSFSKEELLRLLE